MTTSAYLDTRPRVCGLALAFADCAAWSLGLTVTLVLRLDIPGIAVRWSGLGSVIPIACGAQLTAGLIAGLYQSRLRIGSFEEITALVGAGRAPPSRSSASTSPSAGRCQRASRSAEASSIAATAFADALHTDGTPMPETEFPSEVTRRTGRTVDGVVCNVRLADGRRAWMTVSSCPVTLDAQAGRGALVWFQATSWDPDRRRSQVAEVTWPARAPRSAPRT